MLARGAVREFLDRRLDNFSWMKKLSRADFNRAILRLPAFGGFKTSPWLHQMVCFYIGVCRSRFLFLLDMGLGKTKIILDLMQYRINEGTFKKGLVLVPRLVNLAGWRDDIAQHSDLTVSLAHGSVEEKWDALFRQTDTSVIDYHGLLLVLTEKKRRKDGTGQRHEPNEKRVAQLMKHYNFIVPDEIHKCKSNDSLYFRLVRRLSKQAEFFYGNTGTPFGRDPMDLWAQFFLADRGLTLGATKELFRSVFFDEIAGFWGTEYQFNKKLYHQLYSTLQNCSLRYDESEVFDMPPVVRRTWKVKMTEEQWQHYLRAVEGIINAGGHFREMDAPFIRMRQITSGYLDWGDTEGRHRVRFTENPKIAAMEAIIDEIQAGTKGIVFYEYTATGAMLMELMTSMKKKALWLWSGTKDQLALDHQFKNDPTVDWLVVNSHSGAEGPNWQVAKHTVFFESPVSPIKRKQAEKRANRAGFSGTIHDIIAERSVDIRVQEFLREGRDLFQMIVEGRPTSGDIRNFLLPQ
jgi:SNF2 family DNA or RNA helicase